MLFRLLAGVEDEGGGYGGYGGYGDYGAYVYWLRGDARGETTEVSDDTQMERCMNCWYFVSGRVVEELRLREAN